jgi:hypothetical protein
MSTAFCFGRENKCEKLQEENKHEHISFRNYMKVEIYVLRGISFVRKASTKHSFNSVSLQSFCTVQTEERGEMLHLESS